MLEIKNFKNVNLAGQPERSGLYDPIYEHGACGVGFVANIDGTPTHTIVSNAIQVSINLEHRGAIGSDKLTGDGGGLLLQIPDDFLRQVCSEKNLRLPSSGKYGVGMFFMPQDEAAIERCKQSVQKIVESENCKFLGWRDVPCNGDSLGEISRLTQPTVHQLFVTSDNQNSWAGVMFHAMVIPWERSAV